MTPSYSTRALALEQEDRQLHTFADRMTRAEHQAYTNEVFQALIRTEIMPPLDPEHPHASLASLRKSHPRQLADCVATLKSPAFEWQHRATLMVITRLALKLVAGLR